MICTRVTPIFQDVMCALIGTQLCSVRIDKEYIIYGVSSSVKDFQILTRAGSSLEALSQTRDA